MKIKIIGLFGFVRSSRINKNIDSKFGEVSLCLIQHNPLLYVSILGSVNQGYELKGTVESFQVDFILNNVEDELHKNALTLLNDSSLRNNMGNNAVSMLKELFSVESAADVILNEYKLLNEKK